jgi:hypothetical protein
VSRCSFFGMIASASSDRLNLACSLQRVKSGGSVRTSKLRRGNDRRRRGGLSALTA